MKKVILFQGDSITDCTRNREAPEDMGKGYPLLVKGALGYEAPGSYQFFNRGISGNRVVDLFARIKIDFINLKPDYASIYIGVNDTWHEIARQNGVATAKFETVYAMLIDEVQEACPQTKLILIAPFVLEGSATCNTEEKPDRFALFQKDVAEKAAVVEKLADRYQLPLIRLQPAFDEATKRAPEEDWTRDGVHPNPCGHEIIKRLWLETFEKIKD